MVRDWGECEGYEVRGEYGGVAGGGWGGDGSGVRIWG